MSAFATHEVRNQPGEMGDVNLFTTDLALRDAVRVFGAGWAESRLSACGARTGSAHVQELARIANRDTPELRTHDRFGNRIDVVEFCPAWHELMALYRADSVHSLGWTEQRPGAQVARAGLAFLWAQGEAGVGCPGVMTFASIAVLQHQPEYFAKFGDKILSTGYDPSFHPPTAKQSLSVAMAMTEKQGGSDLRLTQTIAEAGAGSVYYLTGHKWFFSAPTSDLFLTLARTEKGISCFLVQGWLDDGRRNFLQLQRLKDKCGNRSNASSEVEFRGLEAMMIGEDGRGIATLLEMAHLTRIECSLGSAALMRQSVMQALHHTGHRTAFQRRLIDQPIMTAVLADLAIESEASMWLSLRAAAALDSSDTSAEENILNRILAPIAKYFVCKRAPLVAAEALECHGGNGFVNENVMARLYRDAPLNGLWEGSGNVICLDVLRALSREPEALPLLQKEMQLASGQHPAMDGWLRRPLPEISEKNARLFVEQIALGLCGSLLLRFSKSIVADAFCRTRLARERGVAFGTLPHDIDLRGIIDRASISAS